MAIKIGKKIVGYNVIDPSAKEIVSAQPANVVQLGEPLDRP